MRGPDRRPSRCHDCQSDTGPSPRFDEPEPSLDTSSSASVECSVGAFSLSLKSHPMQSPRNSTKSTRPKNIEECLSRWSHDSPIPRRAPSDGGTVGEIDHEGAAAGAPVATTLATAMIVPIVPNKRGRKGFALTGAAKRARPSIRACYRQPRFRAFRIPTISATSCGREGRSACWALVLRGATPDCPQPTESTQTEARDRFLFAPVSTSARQVENRSRRVDRYKNRTLGSSPRYRRTVPDLDWH